MARGRGKAAALRVAIDLTVEAGEWPDEAELDKLVRAAVDAALVQCGTQGETELSVVFTDDAHIRALNAGWRKKDKPTNVLSFPAFPIAVGGRLPPMLGDIVLASETVEQEARLESKPLAHHISHLVIHGLFHLLGHDHEKEDEAEAMEALERAALARLAIPDPYA